MTRELIFGLLPDHLMLGSLLVLMLLEMARVDRRWARIVFVAATLAGLAVIAQQWITNYAAVMVADEIVVDRLTVLGKGVLLLCGLAFAIGFAARETFKFWLLAVASMLGGMVILDSAGFASLFIGIELLSLPAFALIVHGEGNGAASEGAFKYLVLSSVASGLLLFGVSLAYGRTGSLAIATWAALLAQGDALSLLAGLLVLCGLFLKAAVFPFHAWAPDAYASARLRVTALLASTLKAAVILALVRCVATVPLHATGVVIVTGLGLVSIFFGNLAALTQGRFKRLLAYSSVAQSGYMIIALLDVTGQRVNDLLWYSLFYALATLLACACIAALNPTGDDELSRLDGQFRHRPVVALLLSVAVLSLAGLPPFPGFFAKLLVFRSVVASGHLVTAIVAFAGSFIGLAYYVGIVLRLFSTETRPAAVPFEPTDARLTAPERTVNNAAA